MSGPDNFDPMANVADAIRAQFKEDAATITALQAEVAALREALERATQGYDNLLELGLLPVQYEMPALELAEFCRAALERTKP